MRRMRPARRARSSRLPRCSERISGRCGSRSPADISRTTFSPRRARRSPASQRRSASASKFPRPRAPAPPPHVITSHEAPSLHLDGLRTRQNSIRRCATGCLREPVKGSARKKFRRWYRARVMEVFNGVDAVVAPAAPASRRRSGRQRSCSTASRWRCRPIWASTPSRSPSSDCPWSQCRCRSSRCRCACRSSPRPWREDIALRVAYALRQRRRRLGAAAARITMQVDLPEVLSEVTAQFARYERALVIQRRPRAR